MHRYYIKQGPDPYSALVNGVRVTYRNVREMDYLDELVELILARLERVAKIPTADLPRALPFIRPIIVIFEE